MRISRSGIAIDVPRGWEGAIGAAASDDEGKAAAEPLPVAHLSTAALSADRGDFGSGTVEHLGPDDAFVALVEYGAECAGTAVFAKEGLPRRLRARGFNRRALQRTIAGQAGEQIFFSHGGRAFCLYVVLGRDHDVAPLLDRVHAALDSIELVP